VNFSNARDLFGINFQIPGAFMKIGGQRVDTQEVKGPFCNVDRIKEFLDLIFNEKFRGPSPRCSGPRAPPRRRLVGEQPVRHPVHGTSPRLRKKGEETAVSLTGCKRGRGGTDTARRWWGTTGGGGARWVGRCELGSEQMRAE
jgi:hypothetical protein